MINRVILSKHISAYHLNRGFVSRLRGEDPDITRVEQFLAATSESKDEKDFDTEQMFSLCKIVLNEKTVAGSEPNKAFMQIKTSMGDMVFKEEVITAKNITPYIVAKALSESKLFTQENFEKLVENADAEKVCKVLLGTSPSLRTPELFNAVYRNRALIKEPVCPASSAIFAMVESNLPVSQRSPENFDKFFRLSQQGGDIDIFEINAVFGLLPPLLRTAENLEKLFKIPPQFDAMKRNVECIGDILQNLPASLCDQETFDFLCREASDYFKGKIHTIVADVDFMRLYGSPKLFSKEIFRTMCNNWGAVSIMRRLPSDLITQELAQFLITLNEDQIQRCYRALSKITLNCVYSEIEARSEKIKKCLDKLLARFRMETFCMGTHHRLGKESTVGRFFGNLPSDQKDPMAVLSDRSVFQLINESLREDSGLADALKLCEDEKEKAAVESTSSSSMPSMSLASVVNSADQDEAARMNAHSPDVKHGVLADQKHHTEEKPVINHALQELLIKDINKYISSRSNNAHRFDDVKLNWTSFFFRNHDLTTVKLKLAYELRECVNKTNDVYQMRDLLKACKETHENHDRNNGCVTKSDFSHLLDKAEIEINKFISESSAEMKNRR